MKVVFRVDASVRIGIGHMVRCLTLANILRDRGVKVHFICRDHMGHMIGALRNECFRTTVLPCPKTKCDPKTEDYAAWLGVSQRVDADDTIQALIGEVPDWLVVDHYSLDQEWEELLRPHVKKILVIDDLANRKHKCDVILDQNYSKNAEDKYLNLTPASCVRLLGPRYALLQPEYRNYREAMRPRSSQIKNILVFFGGSDLENLTAIALEALTADSLRHLHVDVVVGANNPNRKKIERIIQQRARTKLYTDVPNLAGLMADADLAIGAGGVTTWERMSLGLPSIVMSLADNQIPASEALATAKLIKYAGHFNRISSEKVVQEIQSAILNPEILLAMGESGKLHVDGLGGQRVVEAMVPSAIGELKLRPARRGDKDLLFYWGNDSPRDDEAEQSSRTDWDVCSGLFTVFTETESVITFIVEGMSGPIGYISFNIVDGYAEVAYFFDVFVQSQKWTGRLLAEAMGLLTESMPIALCEFDAGSISGLGDIPFIYLKRELCSENNAIQNPKSIAVVSDKDSWINEYIADLQMEWLKGGHNVLWVHDIQHLSAADFCFSLSLNDIIPRKLLDKFKHTLVVHESDLPKGKGWSPLTWQILEGENYIPVTLFEAEESVDSGAIYAQEWMSFHGDELVDELRLKQGLATLKVCKRFVDEYPEIVGSAKDQVGLESFYPRRGKSDSELDFGKPLEAQFNLLRVVDNFRYPAFFEVHGRKYVLRIEHDQDNE